MTMRRHLLLAEHYRLMCLLLENREAALYGKFSPMIAAFIEKNQTPNCNGLAYGDRNALQHYVVNHPADFPSNIIMPLSRLAPNGQPMPTGDFHPVALNTLINQTPMFVQALAPEQQKARAEAIANAIILMVWNADPNPKKAYTTWMLYRYMAKDSANRLALEDLPRTRSYLEIFDKVKNHRELKHKLAINDINRFKSTNELFDAIKDFRENENGEMVSDDYVKRMYEQAMVIYEGDDYEVVRPLSKTASIWFGRNTEWCTAYAPPKTNNMFSSYAQAGALYIVTEKSSGDKWQFFVPDSADRHAEYRDAADRSIDIHTFLRDHPVVDQAFDKFFKADKWEQVDDIWEDNNRNESFVVWFGPEGDGFGIRVAPEGKKFTGLVRDAAVLSINLDKDMNVTVATGALAFGEGRMREILTSLGAKGNCEELTEENFVWQRGKGWGEIWDVKPFLTGNHMAARRIEFSPNNERFYLTEITGIEQSDHDLATIKVVDGEFTMTHHKGWSGLDEEAEAFVAEVVLSKVFNAKWTFNAKDSDLAMPAIEKLADARPQWMDLGKLWQAKGATPLVRERLLAILKRDVSETFDYRFVPGSDDKVIVDEYPNITECVDDEGDRMAKFCADVMRGKEQHEYSSGDLTCPEHDYIDFFKHLEETDKKLFERLCRYMEKSYESEMADIELSKIETAADLETLVEETKDEELINRLDWAYARGCENGADSEAIKALKDAVEKNPHIYFSDKDGVVSGEFEYDVPVFIVLTIEEIMSFGDIGAIDTEGLSNDIGHGHWLTALDEKLSVSEPYYGFSDYDEEAAMHDFEYRIEEMLNEDNA